MGVRSRLARAHVGRVGRSPAHARAPGGRARLRLPLRRQIGARPPNPRGGALALIPSHPKRDRKKLPFFLYAYVDGARRRGALYCLPEFNARRVVATTLTAAAAHTHRLAVPLPKTRNNNRRHHRRARAQRRPGGVDPRDPGVADELWRGCGVQVTAGWSGSARRLLARAFCDVRTCRRTREKPNNGDPILV